MKLIKVKANINGSCEGYVFSLDQELELPESVVQALGSDVTVLEDATEEHETEEKEEQPKEEKGEEKTETKVKEVKEKKNKMVQKTNVVTK